MRLKWYVRDNTNFSFIGYILLCYCNLNNVKSIRLCINYVEICCPMYSNCTNLNNKINKSQITITKLKEITFICIDLCKSYTYAQAPHRVCLMFSEIVGY